MHLDVPQPRSDFALRRHWFFRGVAMTVSVPGLILIAAHVGFASVAIDAGISQWLAAFMVGTIWALPAQVVLIGAVLAGSSIWGVALAVALSSVRLTPMVIAIVPEMRGSHTRRISLYLLSHFVAVTSWVIAMATLRDVPRDLRTSYYFGLGTALVLTNVVVVFLVYEIADALPPMASAALFLLTPLYFLTSLWGSARETAAHIAILLGIALGPVFHIVLPGFDLLAAGVIGGGAAYAFHKMRNRA